MKNYNLVRPHKLNFVVVRRSMEVRYFIEMIIFFVLICTIQYELLRFIKNWNILN